MKTNILSLTVRQQQITTQRVTGEYTEKTPKKETLPKQNTF